MKKVLLLFAFVVSTTNIFAKEGRPDFILSSGNLLYQVKDGKAWISRDAHYGYEDEVIWDSNCYSGDIVIPEQLNGMTVVGILKSAFDGCENLTSIKIPATVKVIEETAFYGTTKLSAITIPASVESLGTYCLRYSGVKKITIEDGTTPLKLGDNGSDSFFSYNQTLLEEIYIGRDLVTLDGKEYTYLFHRNNTLREVTLGSGVTKISEKWFDFCDALEKVTANSGLTKIGFSAFGSCKALKSFSGGQNITEIAEDAFSSCESLQSFTIPPTLKRIEKGTFYGCKSLTELTIPNTVTHIVGKAFNYCSGIKKLTFEDGTSLITLYLGDLDGLEEMYVGRPYEDTAENGSSFTFSNKSLKKVTFGDNVKEIYYGDLSSSLLEKIVIGKGLTKIDASAFWFSSNIQEIHIAATTPPVVEGGQYFKFVDTDKCKLFVPAMSVDAYKTATAWKDFFNIETGLNGISADAEANAEWFDLRGRSISTPRKGLNIIRQNGKTKKVVIR